MSDQTTATAHDGKGGEDRFRPDLEGLRAVAVGLVLAYHAGVNWVAGGYVGVDVFFVLSGFLITGLLIRELSSTGRVSLSQFYARRARRLLPAAAVTLLVTAVLCAFILPPLRLPDVAGDIAAAAAYVSNMRFALQATDYLGAEGAPSPVLHFWSLGVEEQFYVFWPALLAIVSGAAFALGDRARGLRRITVTLVVVLVASLVGSIWLTGVQQPWAFFSLPTRAWELALGGLLALPVAGRFVPRAIAPLLGWAGLLMIVASGLMFDGGSPFPGIAAIVPTAGSALVIASGLRRTASNAAGGPGTGPERGPLVPGPAPLLSLPIVRFGGRISYSLYLWHWPILVLPAGIAGTELPWPARLGLVIVSVIVATASQRWIEDPIRHGKLIGFESRRSLAYAGALTVAVVAVGLGLGAYGRLQTTPTGPVVGGSIDEAPLPTAAPTPTHAPGATPGATAATPGQTAPALPAATAAPVPADLVPSLAEANDDMPVIYGDKCHRSPADTELAECVYGDPDGPMTVVLFGDSHAAQWFPALEKLAQEHDWRLVSMTKSACASVDMPLWSQLFNREYTECTAWREAAFTRIADEHADLVVVSNAFRYTIALDGAMAWSTEHRDLWSAALQSTIRRLERSAGRVLLIGDTPRMAEAPPECLSGHLKDLTACGSPYRTAVVPAWQAADAEVAAATGATFVDPTAWLCFTDPCTPVNGRLLVYRDTHHMTATYARALASRLWETAGMDRIRVGAYSPVARPQRGG